MEVPCVPMTPPSPLSVRRNRPRTGEREPGSALRPMNLFYVFLLLVSQSTGLYSHCCCVPWFFFYTNRKKKLLLLLLLLLLLVARHGNWPDVVAAYPVSMILKSSRVICTAHKEQLPPQIMLKKKEEEEIMNYLLFHKGNYTGARLKWPGQWLCSKAMNQYLFLS